MKFDITFNDVIENGYYKIAKKIYDSGGVRMVIEINKIQLEYQGCEITKQFDFPESSSSVEEKIEAMSQFLDVLFVGIIELKEQYERVKKIFDEKTNKKVKVIDDILRDMYNEKYFEERSDNIY